LFRYEQKINDQKNLLIFVTARILAESGEELVPVSTTQTTPVI
jgi:type II secretory pathway component GspD/PulD (secretin)